MRRAALVLALFSGVIALAAPSTSPSFDIASWNSVAWSPNGEWIAATGMPDYGSAVAFQADSGRVSELSTYIYRGKWSPDGRRVAFVSGGDFAVRTVASGRLDTISPPNHSVDWLDWSPDSEQLVFEREGSLRLARSDGSQQRALVPGRKPAWSPDGTEIAFAREVPDRCQSDIAVIGANGAGERTLASGPEGRTAPVWSPDGSRVAYRAKCSTAVYVVNRDGSGERVVGEFTPAGFYWSPIAWSPDGRWLAVSGSWPRRTTLLEVDGPGEVSFDMGTAPDDSPNWSPSGNRILLARRAEFDARLFIGSLDGSEQAIGRGLAGDWSPDGTSIALVRDVYAEGTLYASCAEQIVIVDLAGRVRSGLTPCKLEGGSRPDVIVGTPGPDFMNGKRGPDRISGGLGNDSLVGGEGADRVYGGPGRDRIQAGSGNDRIATRDGEADHVACGPGQDLVLADALDSIQAGCERVLRR